MLNLNNVVIMGRITKDLETKKTESNLSILEFTLAINSYDSSEQTDYVPVEAWKNNADYLQLRAGKGDLIIVQGRLKTRYNVYKDNKYSKLVVVADKVEIVNKKKTTNDQTISLFEENDQEAELKEDL